MLSVEKQIISVVFSVQNTIPKSYGEEKIVCKKMAASITKIGDMVMKRIYGSTYDYQTGYERNLILSKNEFDLNQVANINLLLSHQLWVKSNLWTSYEVWGIKLGLKKLGGGPRSFMEAIIEIAEESKEAPSHIIKKDTIRDEYIRNKEVYTVYRLSQSQEEQILKAAPR